MSLVPLIVGIYVDAGALAQVVPPVVGQANITQEETVHKNPGNRWLSILAMLALAALVGTVGLLGPGGPEPAHANANNIEVICLSGGFGSTPEEGIPAMVGIKIADENRPWAMVRGNWYTQPGTADTSDYEDFQGLFEEGEQQILQAFPTLEDPYSEADETFTVRFENAASGGNDVECEITIVDNDGAGAHDVRITSTPEDGDTYRLGETIEITMDFTDTVEVEGDVQVGFRIGESLGWRAARYDSGSGSQSLVFHYQVYPGDFDEDGISMDGGYVEGHEKHGYAGSGRIVASGDSVNPWFHGIGDQAGHKVDGSVFATATEIISTPANGDTYGAGETIKVALTYNTPVDVEGDVRVSLRMGTGDWWRSAGYLEGTGTDRLVFGYEVRPGDLDPDGISMDGGYVDENGTAHGYAGGGTIKAAGTDVLRTPRYPRLSHDSTHKVDGVAPTIRSIGFTNASGSDNTYGVGDNITVYVNFNEDVLTLGAPQLTLDFDGTEKTASYAPPPDAWHPITREYDPLPKPFAAFTYTVRVGDTDADGIAIAANALALNGGSIQDGTGNNADISHDALPSNAAHMVSAPGGL